MQKGENQSNRNLGFRSQVLGELCFACRNEAILMRMFFGFGRLQKFGSVTVLNRPNRSYMKFGCVVPYQGDFSGRCSLEFGVCKFLLRFIHAGVNLRSSCSGLSECSFRQVMVALLCAFEMRRDQRDTVGFLRGRPTPESDRCCL